MQLAGDDRRAAEPGDRTRERECEPRQPRDVDAAAARGFGRFTARAQIVAEDRSREDPLQDEREREREQERDREARVGQERRQPVLRIEPRRLGAGGERASQRSADEFEREIRRDEVEHQRRDDFVGAEARLHPAGDRAPHAAADRAGDEQQHDADRTRAP